MILLLERELWETVRADQSIDRSIERQGSKYRSSLGTEFFIFHLIGAEQIKTQ